MEYSEVNHRRGTTDVISDQYPEYTYLQRIPGTIITSRVKPSTGANPVPVAVGIQPRCSTITFNGPQVSSNLFLCSDAYIKVKFRMREISWDIDDPLEYNFQQSISTTERVALKPGMIIANCMNQADIRLNQHTISYDNPRYVQKHVNVQSFGKTFIERRLSTSGAQFWDNIGQMTFTGESAINTTDVSTMQGLPAGDEVIPIISSLGVDNGYAASCDAFESYTTFSTPDIQLGGTREIELTEQLAFGPFKPRNLDGFGNSPYSGMSDLIPYVSQVGVKLQLENFTANLCEPYFQVHLQPVAANFFRKALLDDGVISAELVLRWVQPRRTIVAQLPRQLYIPSWQYDHRSFVLNNGLPMLMDEQFDFSFENLHTRQVPSQIMVWATIDKDDVNSYLASPPNVMNPVPTVDKAFPTANNNQTAFESNCEFNKLTIRTNALGGSNVWDETYNKEEQYMYTTKNCHPDFPWDKTKWSGFVLKRESNIGLVSRYYATKAYNVMILDSDDLKSYNVAGPKTGKLLRDQVWNFSGTLTPQDGLMDNTNYIPGRFSSGYPPPISLGPVLPLRRSERVYKFHVLFLYKNFRINLGVDGVVSSDYISKFL